MRTSLPSSAPTLRTASHLRHTTLMDRIKVWFRQRCSTRSSVRQQKPSVFDKLRTALHTATFTLVTSRTSPPSHGLVPTIRARSRSSWARTQISETQARNLNGRRAVLCRKLGWLSQRTPSVDLLVRVGVGIPNWVRTRSETLEERSLRRMSVSCRWKRCVMGRRRGCNVGS